MDTVVMPKMSDMMEEGKILLWSKQVGDQIKKGDVLGEVETEKVNIDIESYFEGTLRALLAPVGATVKVGEPIAFVGAPTEPLPAANGRVPQAQATVVASNGTNSRITAPPPPIITTQPQPVAVAQSATSAVESGERIKVSPLARRLAADHHVDLRQVRGTGPEGRIVKEDVDAAIAAAASAPQSATPQQGVVTTGEVEIVPLGNMRRTIARRLQESAQTTPHFYLTMAMDATRLSELRDQLNTALAQAGQAIKISYNDLIVMAVARALELHPEINVTYDSDRILRRKSIHIGVAVALDAGLIVPVVRDANKRGIADLSREIARLVEAARTNKLKPDEFQGGTFTISNLGMLEVESFTAIINPPEAAILAVGAVVPTPVVIDGQVVVRDQIKMTLSSDHRAIDGAQAARFMRDVKRFIETPALLML